MLAPGTYQGTITETIWVRASTGTSGLAVTVNILDEYSAENHITGTIWISPKSAGMARSQFHALGVDPDADDIAEIGASVSLVGRSVDVTLKEEEYKGKVRLKLDRFGSGQRPPTKDELITAQKLLWEAKENSDAPESKPPITSQEAIAEGKQRLADAVEAAESKEDDGSIPF